MQNSHIEWTDHTFNPWWGCIKVSPGCEHCYAETLARRYGHAVWGPAKTTERRMMSENYWKQPLKWDEAARKAGTRARVFCASMADVFEEHPQVVDARARLINLIDETPNLDWLSLTKRPENILNMIDSDFPDNVWIGTSVENQEQAIKRIPELLKVPAKVHFLSCEPLLGAVNIRQWLGIHTDDCLSHNILPTGMGYWHCDCGAASHIDSDIEWVIVGGESGHGARPMHPIWARSLRDQASAAGVAFHFKQWGAYEPYEEDTQAPFWNDQHGRCIDGHALDILNPETSELNPGWHEDSLYGTAAFRRVGKHAAGRLLDGREWNELPS